MNDIKQEAYMEVRDELLEKKQFVLDINAKVNGQGFGAGLSPQVAGMLEGIDYALAIVFNLMLQDRKS